MAHNVDLRRIGVSVKRYYAELALDMERKGGFEEGMSKEPRVKSADEIAWEEKCAERVKWVREISGLNQTQMGRMLECGQQAVSSYERGKRSLDPYLMLRFCARFRTTLDYVYRGVLAGTHPGLATLLVQAHPELIQQPKSTEPSRGTVLSEYREAIKGHPD